MVVLKIHHSKADIGYSSITEKPSWAIFEDIYLIFEDLWKGDYHRLQAPSQACKG